MSRDEVRAVPERRTRYTPADRRTVVRAGPIMRRVIVSRVLTLSCGHNKRVTGLEATTPPLAPFCSTCCAIRSAGPGR